MLKKIAQKSRLFFFQNQSVTSSSSEDEAWPVSLAPRRRPPRMRGHGGRKISTPTVTDTSNISRTNLEKMIRTHPIWFLPNVQRDEANLLLQGKTEGVSKL